MRPGTSPEVGAGCAAALGGHGGGAVGIGVDHGDQFDIGQRGVFLGVEAAQVAGADDGGSNRFGSAHSPILAIRAGGPRVFCVGFSTPGGRAP